MKKFKFNIVGRSNKNNRDKWIEKTLKNLPAGLTVLDAGAGEQQYRKYCSHLNYISQDFAEYDGSGDNSGLQTGSWDYQNLDIVSDITNIPRDNSSFDIILCTEVFEHVPDPLAAIKEFQRLLKPGGTLIITAPFCSLTHFAPYHYSSGFNRYYYEYHLKESGFEVDSIEPNGNYFEYLAQEIFHLPKYSRMYSRFGMFSWGYLLVSIPILVMLQLSTLLDKGSSELLCFGYHVIAKKSSDK